MTFHNVISVSATGRSPEHPSKTIASESRAAAWDPLCSRTSFHSTGGWPSAIHTTFPPPSFSIPSEIFLFEPDSNTTHKFFFKGTPKEISLRQIFCHQPLDAIEEKWLEDFKEEAKKNNFTIPAKLEPLLGRILNYNQRRYGEAFLSKALEHCIAIVAWRNENFPVHDTEPDIRVLLDKGVMYWAGRDCCLRPLLIFNLGNAPRNTNPVHFKRLIVFCFEWGLRYLMVPGKVETCVVLFDVRGVPFHQFPVGGFTDLVNMLTRQYPFRLNKMLIIHDSFFIQTVWNLAKAFLTEVQQQKMAFYKTGFREDLIKDYALNQLEKAYGGTRGKITVFYPFPLPPGPFTAGYTGPPDPNAIPGGWRAVDSRTAAGSAWHGDFRPPIKWSSSAKSVFAEMGLTIQPDCIADTSRDVQAVPADSKKFLSGKRSVKRSKTGPFQKSSSEVLVSTLPVVDGFEESKSEEYSSNAVPVVSSFVESNSFSEKQIEIVAKMDDGSSGSAESYECIPSMNISNPNETVEEQIIIEEKSVMMCQKSSKGSITLLELHNSDEKGVALTLPDREEKNSTFVVDVKQSFVKTASTECKKIEHPTGVKTKTKCCCYIQ